MQYLIEYTETKTVLVESKSEEDAIKHLLIIKPDAIIKRIEIEVRDNENK